MSIQSLTTNPSKPSSSRSKSCSSHLLPWQGIPFTSLWAAITVPTLASLMAAMKGGRYISLSFPSDTSMGAALSPPNGSPPAIRCLAQARTWVERSPSRPCSPQISCFPISETTRASSPKVSPIRPQRGSRATSRLGPKVQYKPLWRISAAVSAPMVSSSSGLNVDARLIFVGYTVHPSIKAFPWMASIPIRSGTFSLLSCASSWRAVASFGVRQCRKDPTSPLRILSARSLLPRFSSVASIFL